LAVTRRWQLDIKNPWLRKENTFYNNELRTLCQEGSVFLKTTKGVEGTARYPSKRRRGHQGVDFE